MPRKLVVVSNRLPIVMQANGGAFRFKPGGSGLVQALDPLLRDRGGVWIGWPGAGVPDHEQVAALIGAEGRRRGYRFGPVFLDQRRRMRHGPSVRWLAALLALCLLIACRHAEGGAEAVADAFVDAYFAHADQARARSLTAFGATKMLDREIAETRPLRDTGYTPSEASLQVTATRGARSMRGERVRFDYTLHFAEGPQKHADVELSRVAGDWKVVRVAVGDQPLNFSRKADSTPGGT